MIQTNELTHHYLNAPSPALNKISLTIEKGSCIGLLGPNGAGKTTLISLLSGLQQVQSGAVLINNRVLSSLTKFEAQAISVVPQDFAFYPRLTVWENMCFFAALYKVKDKTFLKNLLESVDLNSYNNIFAKNLSGGLKRRLNFAIALINSPQVIFMDEPTVGVDPQSRQFILNNVTKLTEKGITVIYTSHYLHEIELICQRIVILDQGMIRYQGDINHILNEKAESTLFVATDKVIDNHLLNKFSALATTDQKGLVIKSNKHKITDILNELEENHYEITSVNYGHGTLEAFYLNLLRERGEPL